ncbi:hypothetical protein COLO4_28281 [Corchorus olitorius]|uniref:Pentatricopeptide repeat-containing protein n=1 Tax=Corchorus olitorius TaxID=93759 RepID=A0A1R3HM32_9ROSI|nr:hypothetical protein COLO4_28281 [Corchorus olitorius]
MLQLNVLPNAVTLASVLPACSLLGSIDFDMLGKAGRVDEAYEFVEQLGEEGNFLEIWGSLLASCRLHKKIDLGEVVAKKLLQMSTGNSMSGYHVMLSNIYAEEGNWNNVDRVRKAMKEKGMRKDVGCSWIEIAGCVNYFSSKDQEHPQSD